MKLPASARCLAVIAVFVGTARATFAGITTQPSDKSQYTLFNPTPENEMRDMDTDRPNKTNTPHTIDAGHLQIETGFFDYDYYRDRYQGDNARIETLDLGQFNVRLGILDNLELNAIVSSYDFLRDTDYLANQSTRQNGFGDLTFGGKINLWGNDGSDDVWATALGIQPQFKIPSAREDIGNGHPELTVGAPFLINLPAGFHLGPQTTPSWERNSTNSGYVAGCQNSASIDRVFFGNFDIYLEYWSHITTEQHLEAQQTLDLGFTFPLSDNVTVDSGVNLGLNHASDTFELLSGISLRI